MDNIHASSVFYKNKGILFVGASGAGKSDICLRIIMNRGGVLIADDRTDLYVNNNDLYASCPQSIRGLLEVRGIGIKKFDFVLDKKIDLVIELVSDFKQVERMPEAEFFVFEQVKIPKIKLYAFETSILDKIDIVLI